MQTVRRFLVIAALMFWQGGFVFYAGVVVPVARHHVRPLGMQTLVTREVTNWLNVAGVVTLLLLGWDAIACPGPTRWRNRVRWLAWLGVAAGLALLAALHVYLEGTIDRETGELLDYAAMRLAHRTYLWVSAIQWALAVVWIGLTLQAWTMADRTSPPGSEEV